MSTDKKIFGKPISHKDADRMFIRGKEIRERSRDKIRLALTGDPEATRYYIGLDQKDGLKEDIAYVFTKGSLQKVIDRILADEADGMVLFNAVRGENDSKNDDGTSNDISGRPTVIMFPFKFAVTDETTDELDITNLLDDGFEHPGTGDEDGDIHGINTIYRPKKGGLPEVIQQKRVHTSNLE